MEVLWLRAYRVRVLRPVCQVTYTWIQFSLLNAFKYCPAVHLSPLCNGGGWGNHVIWQAWTECSWTHLAAKTWPDADSSGWLQCFQTLPSPRDIILFRRPQLCTQIQLATNTCWGLVPRVGSECFWVLPDSSSPCGHKGTGCGFYVIWT
jgi:hypothetical protein